MADIDFEFDFETAIAREYQTEYQAIAYIAEGLNSNSIDAEKAIRDLIKINSTVLSKVLTDYNRELLNEL